MKLPCYKLPKGLNSHAINCLRVMEFLCYKLSGLKSLCYKLPYCWNYHAMNRPRVGITVIKVCQRFNWFLVLWSVNVLVSWHFFPVFKLVSHILLFYQKGRGSICRSWLFDILLIFSINKFDISNSDQFNTSSIICLRFW